MTSVAPEFHVPFSIPASAIGSRVRRISLQFELNSKENQNLQLQSFKKSQNAPLSRRRSRTLSASIRKSTECAEDYRNNNEKTGRQVGCGSPKSSSNFKRGSESFPIEGASEKSREQNRENEQCVKIRRGGGERAATTTTDGTGNKAISVRSGSCGGKEPKKSSRTVQKRTAKSRTTSEPPFVTVVKIGGGDKGVSSSPRETSKSLDRSKTSTISAFERRNKYHAELIHHKQRSDSNSKHATSNISLQRVGQGPREKRGGEQPYVELSAAVNESTRKKTGKERKKHARDASQRKYAL